MNICKRCLHEIAGRDFENLETMLRLADKPHISYLWESALTKKSPIGEYFKLINAKDFRHLTWDYNPNEEVAQFEKDIEPEGCLSLEILKEKYGYGYPDNEYYLFEKKFTQLKPSFQLLTTMHEEYFKEYCINKVKETLAKARGDFKEAKEWASMVKDVADAGKLKPSQMSKADLSGGMDTFGQLARMVEEESELMPLLPQFVELPKDKVDVVLWLYINYIRDLKGLPECEYKDIWAFYDERAADYESQMSDLKEFVNSDE
ncbi:hypothetical protein ABE354_22520 [Brevibacillus laterosporus]|uniref:hypothetical protein n=1 Tax=Brevibacillus laterosporus TaxID=1465 RepID=UPI003D197092